MAAAAMLNAGPLAHAQDTTAPAVQSAAPQAQPNAAPAQTPSTAYDDIVERSRAVPDGLEPPPDGMGQIIFFRPSGMAGMALTFTLEEDHVTLGYLRSGHYIIQSATPGIHAYEIGHNDTMRIEVEAGGTYYALENTQLGILAGRAVLSPSNRATFEAALPHMRPTQPLTQTH